MSIEESGCQYVGPLPLTQIVAIIAAQSSLTTTQPLSTLGSVG
jgi:hypothetical protein